jgi:hypothetical protein
LKSAGLSFCYKKLSSGNLTSNQRRVSQPLAARRAAFGCTLGAAVIDQVNHQLIHGGEVGRVDELAALAPLRNQSGALQILQVEGEG